jgi:acid phosphatase type 7
VQTANRACVIALIASVVIAGASPRPSPPPTITVAAVGDIVCDPHPRLGPDVEKLLGGCASAETLKLVATLHPQAILALGDEQYENGTLDAFKQAYAPTWGRYKKITHPTPGNHEYYSSPQADGYFQYFGAAAGPRPQGYYSFNLGAWHIISLNANCQSIGGCGPGSPEEQWLRADLHSNRSACTLAFWHQPRFSSGTHGNDTQYATFWDDLYAAHTDMVLNGHDHDYERFAPQTPLAQSDPERGITEFVVGTGGRSHSIFLRVRANSQVRAGGTFGILTLTLQPRGFIWRFMPIAGYSFSDRGAQSCHAPHAPSI